MSQTAPRPNLLFIFPDQWRGDCLSSLGHPVVETPFLDQLAAEGVTFTAAYSPCPTCIATRACLATGLTPASAGRLGYQDGVPWRYETTLMRCLRDGGYQTLLAGKTHFYPQRAALGFEEMQLYDTLNLDPGFESDYRLWLQRESGGSVQDSTVGMHSNSMIARPWTAAEHLHANSWTATVAIQMLERRDPTRPFFLQLGFHRPHPPLDPPLAFFDRYRDCPLPPVPVGDWAAGFAVPATRIDPSSGLLPPRTLDRARRAYYAQLAHLDDQIGRVIHFLRRRGWLDTTTIVFSSDHGELLGDHHLYSKVNAFEGSAKAPLIVRPAMTWGGRRGARCGLPVSHFDLMPTFLEEAGLPVPGTVEGRSLAAALTGAPIPWRDFIHGEHAPRWQFVTDGQEKLIWVSDRDETYFFDLRTDPQELTNRAHDPACADRVALWRQRLIGVLAARPEDGLSDGHRLIPGVTPHVRPHLLEPRRDADGVVRPPVQG